MGDHGGLKVDGAVSSQLANVADAANRLEKRGYDCCWTAEINHDPFLPLVLAAEHTTTIELGTSIAVAFARNPMTVANVGWDLQAYSDGRFILGLGSQIKPHIENRFSMPWSRPVQRMREFVLAMREIWSCWQTGSKLAFEGDFYTHKLMTPMFTPEPLAHGFPKVFVAAVGEAMTEMCGEVADGLLAHAFTTKRYFEEVTTPALLRGMERSGRKRSEFQLSCPLFVVTGNDEAELADQRNRHAQADRLLRIDARLPQGSRTAWLGRPADRTAPDVAGGRMGCDGFAHRRRDPQRVRGGGPVERRRPGGS